MLSWLKGLLFGRAEEERWDAYHPGERQIYRYFDGQKWIAEDPMVLYERFSEEAPSIAIDVKVAYSIHPDNNKKYKELIGRIQKIFSLKPFAEGGLGQAEAADLLDHFLAYCERLKKNSRPSPTPAAGTSGPTEPTSGASPATPNTSASGSTPSGPSTGPPAPSPSGGCTPAGPSALPTSS
jgi:hypothetical protein